MNHELARSLFMDYLYDEIEEEDKQRLEAYLEEHPARVATWLGAEP